MSDSWIFPDWPLPRHVHAAVTTREGPGMSAAPFARFNLGRNSGDEVETVIANRDALRQALALPAPPRWLHQVHGTAVADLGPLSDEKEIVADAAVSRLPGTVLAILTADCLPVLFCADDGSEIGVAHAGWRGLAAGVLESTVTQFASSPGRVKVWLGPCVGAASYEVGNEVRDAFIAGDEGAADCFCATRPGHWLCDLPALARLRLTAAGIQHIDGGDLDTFNDARFYSYRREGTRSGRFASLIWIDRSAP